MPWRCKVVTELFNNRIGKGCPQRPAHKERPQVPAAGDVPFLSASGDTPCGFVSVLLVCRRLAAHLLTCELAALCCFRDGCG